MSKKIIPFFVVSLIGFIIGFILTNSVKFNLCLHTQYNCREFFNNIGDPLFFGSIALSIIFLVLLFVPRAWSTWKKFALWFIPLAALLFSWYPDPGSGDYFSPYPEQVFQWVSAVYIGVSLGIISISLVNDWRKGKGKTPLAAFWYWLAAIILSIPALYLFNPLVKLVLSGLTAVFNLFS